VGLFGDESTEAFGTDERGKFVGDHGERRL
jgi:hypothetical protein